jgi:hypothetical protein
MIRHRPLFLIRAILSKDAKGAMNDGAREQPLHNNADRIASQHTGKRIEMIEGGGKSMGPKRDLLWRKGGLLTRPFVLLIASIANQETIFN